MAWGKRVHVLASKCDVPLSLGGISQKFRAYISLPITTGRLILSLTSAPLVGGSRSNVHTTTRPATSRRIHALRVAALEDNLRKVYSVVAMEGGVHMNSIGPAIESQLDSIPLRCVFFSRVVYVRKKCLRFRAVRQW